MLILFARVITCSHVPAYIRMCCVRKMKSLRSWRSRRWSLCRSSSLQSTLSHGSVRRCLSASFARCLESSRIFLLFFTRTLRRPPFAPLCLRGSVYLRTRSPIESASRTGNKKKETESRWVRFLREVKPHRMRWCRTARERTESFTEI